MSRTQCPVCLHSIRVDDGRIVSHTRSQLTMFSPTTHCPGSGAEVKK